tara:strand:+ start:41 stop:505 length:465 start_codon:yes stop_codon:yes gene_type:complete
MKTYKQFTNDMQEGIVDNPVTRFVGKTYNKIKPLKNFTRFTNIKKLRNNPNMSLVDKASTIAGVVAPYSLPAYAKDIVQSGKTDSLLDKSVNFLGKQNNKVPFLPKSTTKDFDPDKDLGKRASDFIGKKINKIFNRRKQNMGASDLKNISPGMS